MKIVETAINNARLTLSVLVFLLVTGTMAYISIPKEAEPDIQIPIIYVSMHLDGISPEDSERLLLRPMETALKSIQGVKKMTGTAYQGGGNVLLEFQAGADLDKALSDVRNKVDDARRDLPSEADEPTVNEVNISEFPVLVVTLSGDVPERVLDTPRFADSSRRLEAMTSQPSDSGLRLPLPGSSRGPAHGPAHLADCLGQLALFPGAAGEP